MAKFLKHFGICKKPPAPPTKDYVTEQQSLYAAASVSEFKNARFEKSHSKPALLQEYTDPLDFRKEAETASCEDENFYTNPTEEDMYSEPYEMSIAELASSSALGVLEEESILSVGLDDFYDEVSNQDGPPERLLEPEKPVIGDDGVLPDVLVVEGSSSSAVEYDEPWEWGASPSSCRLGPGPPIIHDGSPLSSSGGYPTLDYDGGSSANLLDSESSLSFEFREDNDMPIRHLYETAFDSKVKREANEDMDRLTQSPILRGESSSSTSSPGSAGRETNSGRLKAPLYNGNGLSKNGRLNGHHHRNGNARKSEKASRRSEALLLPDTDNNGTALPPELPKPRLPPSNSRLAHFKHDKRKGGLPDRSVPTQPLHQTVSSLTGQALKIQAVIENGPTSIRSSQSSSSTSSLEENRNQPPPTTELAKRTVPASKSMSALKAPPISVVTNGNNTAKVKALAALNDELTNVFKSKFKPGGADPCFNRPSLFDNNNVVEAVTTSTLNNAVPPNAPTRNEICPKCCQPMVAVTTPRKSQSLADAQQFQTSSLTFSLLHSADSASSTRRNVLLCKCSAVQSPENDVRPLAEYDMPWDVPKRFAPIIVGPLNHPGSSGNSSGPENENENVLAPLSTSTSATSTTSTTLVTSAVSQTTREEESVQLPPPPPEAPVKHPRRNLELNLFEPKDFKCLDFESNSAPAALNKMGADTTKGKEEDEAAVLAITKSPSETQITQNDPIFECAKFKLPTGPAMRKNLNLNFNTTNNAPSNKNQRQGLGLNFGFSSLSARGETVDAAVPLEEQGWYHGSISRIDAENSLRVLKEGSYLVRNSESSKKDYSLSLKSARGFMHMKIVNNEGSYILGQFSKPFPSIPEMIHHYSNNKLPIRGAEHMSLLYPVIDQLL